ncbi:MAG: hypothetical protein P8184_13315 [Calditrichia bacterium]
MKQAAFGILIAVLLMAAFGCNKRVTSPIDTELPDSSRINVPVFGQNASFDLVAWNVENFPKLGTTTVTDVAEIMNDLNADIYAMEEVSDTVSFRDLLAKLKDYDGTYSTDVYSFGTYQKTAVIYNKNLIRISNKKMLFPNDSYSFPRPPLQVSVSATRDSKTFDFNLIVLHLKASAGAENEARRRSAVKKLKEYLDTEIASGQEKDYIVVGDWNDILSDPAASNVFQVLLDDSLNYRFLTKPLSKYPDQNASYIGYSSGSLIDQILISADVFPEYSGGNTQVIKIDQYFNNYVSEVSDHRPVGANFPVF